LAKEAPGIELRVQSLSPDWIAQLQRGEIDLKLGRKYHLPSGLHSQDLLEERFSCVVARDHPAPQRRLTLDEYAALRHLDVEPNPGAPAKLGAQLLRHGLTRRVALMIPHFMVAPFIVASSDLALTASERLLAPFISMLPLRTLALPLKLDTYTLTQVWAERSQTDAGHCWLRAVVARAAG
jgi:DNA-binding transcriptional LysR family regulator